MIFDGSPIHQTDRKQSAARPDEKKKRLYTLQKRLFIFIFSYVRINPQS
jgi:hypothetical protein